MQAGSMMNACNSHGRWWPKCIVLLSICQAAARYDMLSCRAALQCCTQHTTSPFQADSADSVIHCPLLNFLAGTLVTVIT